MFLAQTLHILLWQHTRPKQLDGERAVSTSSSKRIGSIVVGGPWWQEQEATSNLLPPVHLHLLGPIAFPNSTISRDQWFKHLHLWGTCHIHALSPQHCPYADKRPTKSPHIYRRKWVVSVQINVCPWNEHDNISQHPKKPPHSWVTFVALVSCSFVSLRTVLCYQNAMEYCDGLNKNGPHEFIHLNAS